MSRRPASLPSEVRSATPLTLLLAGMLLGLLAAKVFDRLTRDEGVELFRTVRDLAAENFVRDVDESELAEDAVQGLLHGLDRYSRYYPPTEVAHLDRETSGEFRGIGVVFRTPVREGQVLFPFPGSPASRVGIEVGDTIVEIDGRTVTDLEAGQLQEHIQQAEGRSLRLLVRDLAGVEREVEVVPERIVDPTVRHTRLLEGEGSIGYLAIVSFSHRTPGEFDEALAWLRAEGAESLIIDLRGNPGGILDAAILVANRFIPEGRIVATRTRRLTQVTMARAEEATCTDLPLVLLVDDNSASASEVLAGALQDHHAAALVGISTYGKGTVQTITPLARFDARVKVTTATYYTPAWRRIERHLDDGEISGIAPDVLVSLEDAEKRALYNRLATYSPPPAAMDAIRAWEKAEGVALVDPPLLDSQLRAAVDLLR